MASDAVTPTPVVGNVMKPGSTSIPDRAPAVKLAGRWSYILCNTVAAATGSRRSALSVPRTALAAGVIALGTALLVNAVGFQGDTNPIDPGGPYQPPVDFRFPLQFRLSR